MGQTNSTESSSTEEELLTGVSLAPELEADIVRDFTSQTLQEEWNKFGTGILQRRNERMQVLQQAAQQRHQDHQLKSASRQMRLTTLEERIDQQMAHFADVAIAANYDATRLGQKFGFLTTKEYDDINKESKPLPCLGQRAHWIDCQRKYAVDSRPCNAYVDALEACVRQTIANDHDLFESN